MGFYDWVRNQVSLRGEWVVIGCTDNKAYLCDAHSGTTRCALSGHTGQVRSVAYSHDGTFIVTGSDDRSVRTWSADNATELRVMEGHTNAVTGVACSHGSKPWIASCSDDGTSRVWDTSTGAQLRVLGGQCSEIHSIAFSPDDTELLSAGIDTTTLWDASSGTILCVFSRVAYHDYYAVHCAFSPDGAYVAAACSDNTARVWNAKLGTEMCVLTGHCDEVLSIAFSPGGDRIATCGKDNTVRLWEWRKVTASPQSLRRATTLIPSLLSVLGAPSNVPLLGVRM